jgi:hypothetical protein
MILVLCVLRHAYWNCVPDLYFGKIRAHYKESDL